MGWQKGGFRGFFSQIVGGGMSRCSFGAGNGSYGAKELQVIRNVSYFQLISVWSIGSVLSMRGRESGFGGCGRVVFLKSRGVLEGLFFLFRFLLVYFESDRGIRFFQRFIGVICCLIGIFFVKEISLYRSAFILFWFFIWIEFGILVQIFFCFL